MKKTKIERLRELLKYVRMESCDFSEGDLMATRRVVEGQMTDFIQERTRRWRESWVIPIVEELIAAEERRRNRRKERRARL